MDDLLSFVFLMFAATLRVATPLVLCAMGGLFSEKSGIVDVGLEGKMLMAAFFAAATAAVTGSAWLGVAAAIAAAEAMALLHGFACITWRGNQVVSGVALNILAAGLTVVLGAAWFARGGQTPALESEQRLMPLFFPRAGDSILVYVALASVPLTWWIIDRTRFGLRLRAVGEMPLAVDAAGISVAWLRYRAVLLCGLFAGLAGAYLSIAQNAGFSRDMTAGQGFIALAAIIFGKWRPFPALRRLPDLRPARCGGDPAAGRRDAGHGRSAGAADPGFALSSDRVSAGRLHRPRRARPRRSACPTKRSTDGRPCCIAGAPDDAARLCALLEVPCRCGGARRATARIHGGCNVENAAYPQGRCAEAVGHRRPGGGRRDAYRRSALVIGPADELITPCGGCRQKLREFAPDDLPIHLCGPDGLHRTVTLGELLPMSFGPHNLPSHERGDRVKLGGQVSGFRPKVAVVLGSGLGGFADDVKAIAAIPYGELPGFPVTGVSSHAGQLVLGHVGPTPVAVLQGRAHTTSVAGADEMKGAIRAMAALGCETLLQTNAAGSLRLDMPPGSPMVISDHINFTGVNPLFGEPWATTASSTWSMPTIPSWSSRCWRWRGQPTSSVMTASISGSAARASRRRPRSAPPARWAPTRSACRPCRRRSSRGRPA